MRMSEARRMWLWTIALAVFTFLGQNMCVWPAPRFFGGVAMMLLQLSLLTAFVFLAAIPASIYHAASAVVGWKKEGEFLRRISKSLAALCFIALWLPAFRSAILLRHRAFVQASYVGDRIVEALAQYRKDKGEYPERLEQLVPERLDEIPYTGMIAYPEFTYVKDRNYIWTKPGEYELRIDCTSGGLNWDQFIYWPSEEYPDQFGGNGVERVRTWAYIHE